MSAVTDVETILSSGVRLTVPLAFAACGEYLAERAGTLNISVEAMMLGKPVVAYIRDSDCAWLPADFLREVWAAGNDIARVGDYVCRAAEEKPAHVPAAACQILPGGRVKC